MAFSLPLLFLLLVSNDGNAQDYGNMTLTELKAMAKDAGIGPERLRAYGRLTAKKTYIDALSSGGATVPFDN